MCLLVLCMCGFTSSLILILFWVIVQCLVEKHLLPEHTGKFMCGMLMVFVISTMMLISVRIETDVKIYEKHQLVLEFTDRGNAFTSKSTDSLILNIEDPETGMIYIQSHVSERVIWPWEIK